MISNNYELAGKVLGYGRYRLEWCIKHSKMSSVYQGIDLLLQRPVAVKVMNGNRDSDFLLRFQREARIMAHLDHANIVPIYDYGEQDGQVYLVMPYLPSGSLQDALELQGSFSLQKTCIYIQQVADTLDYIHSLNVIHRDLKPSNFLLHPDGRLLLSDFGIARMKHRDGKAVWSTITDKGTPIGTLGYMAPETIRGKAINFRIDVYALGIVIYQMLNGDIPFKGDTYAVLIQQLQGVLPSLHLLDPTIPSQVDAVIQKATDLEPEMRYTSAGALAQALQEAAISYPLSPSHSTVINPHYTSKLPLDEIFSNTRQAPDVLQKQHTSVNVSVTQVKSRAMHANETHSPQRKAYVPRFFNARILILILIICGLVLPFSIGRMLLEPFSTVLVPSSTLPTPVPSAEQQAVGTVNHYYDAWNKYNYVDAFSQLAPDYQKTHPYNTLLYSYENTLHSSITINNTLQIAYGIFKVTIIDFAIEKSPIGAKTVIRVYHGYFIVKKVDNAWRLIPYFKY